MFHFLSTTKTTVKKESDQKSKRRRRKIIRIRALRTISGIGNVIKSHHISGRKVVEWNGSESGCRMICKRERG